MSGKGNPAGQQQGPCPGRVQLPFNLGLDGSELIHKERQEHNGGQLETP